MAAWAVRFFELEGRRVTAEKSVTRPEPNGLWKDGDEAWVC
jgi:hypothetical protein